MNLLASRCSAPRWMTGAALLPFPGGAVNRRTSVSQSRYLGMKRDKKLIVKAHPSKGECESNPIYRNWKNSGDIHPYRLKSDFPSRGDFSNLLPTASAFF